MVKKCIRSQNGGFWHRRKKHDYNNIAISRVNL